MLHAVYGCFICLKMLLQYSLFHKILYTSIHINPIYISWSSVLQAFDKSTMTPKKVYTLRKKCKYITYLLQTSKLQVLFKFFFKKKKKSKLFLKNQLITFEITINYIVHYFFKNFNENYYNRGWSIAAHVRVITTFENWSYFS